jgi:hypothetical protein
VLLRELIRGRLVDGAAPTVSSESLVEASASAPEPDGEVLSTLEAPFKGPGRSTRSAGTWPLTAAS